MQSELLEITLQRLLQKICHKVTLLLYDTFENIFDLKVVKETGTKFPKGIVKHS